MNKFQRFLGRISAEAETKFQLKLNSWN